MPHQEEMMFIQICTCGQKCPMHPQEDMKTTDEWEKEFDTFWDISKDILVDRADGTLNAVKKELNAFIKQAILTARKEGYDEGYYKGRDDMEKDMNE